MKKLFLLFGILVVTLSVYGQSEVKRNITITKTSPTLNLNGSTGQVNFNNNDVTITNSSSNNLVIDGAAVTTDDGLIVGGTSGLIITKLILKESRLTAIDSYGDTLTFYTQVTDRINSDTYFVEYTQGTSAPSTTPSRIGLLYMDTSANKLYFSSGTSSSSDWTIVN